MTPAILIAISAFSLLGTFVLTSLAAALRSIHEREGLKILKSIGRKFFYRPLHLFFFPNDEYEGLFFATTCAQNMARFFFAGSAALFLFQAAYPAGEAGHQDLKFFGMFLLLLFFGALSFSLGDWIPRILGTRFPTQTLEKMAFLSSFFLLTVFPITFVFLKITRSFSRNIYLDTTQEPESKVKGELFSIIRQADLKEELTDSDKKLISSVLSFSGHLTREVMVPRVDVFSLDATTTIKEAGQLLDVEGYSRVPVYEETVDNIVGILMYKDILKKYMEYEENGCNPDILKAPISSIQKPALYTPETKKISSLLQEFRKKQVHLAIVVDEYGGTEGIITIEDILEDIVGQIADEYDVKEELFIAQPDGAWIVDATITLLEVEQQLGIKIPEEGDFDTLAGYLFQCAGEIPPKGFTVESDEFIIEVLRSNDRMVEKVKIKPRVISEEAQQKEERA